jgi:bifunctional non-homologous end joining protein LigD
VENPAVYYAFDLLAVDDFDLRSLPLTERKTVLQMVLPPAGVIRFLEHFEETGELLYQQVQKLGLEGIVAKRADSAYRSGRSDAWLKIRTRRSEEFVVVGFTAPKGSRTGFGALHLGLYVEGQLTYSGRAGSGFSDAQLDAVRKDLEAARQPEPPCVGPIPDEKSTTWVHPTLVCEVEFTEWTEEGLLRQPVFLRFRDDKKPEECVGGGAAGRRYSGEPLNAPASQFQRDEQQSKSMSIVSRGPAAPAPRLDFTNVEKNFWPENGYTKGELIEYYRTISPWMLPYLADRPLVLTRYPDGIAGKSFFQQDAPGFVPDWIRTERMWSEQAQREVRYFICDDSSTLLYLVNLGTIPIHVWGSRTERIERPDWCILDLDPKDAPFSDVIRVAQTTHALCDSIGLPNLVKTSGSSGLHVLIPLGCQCRHDESRGLGELLARLIAAELPDIATVTRQVSRRGGKVYVDYLQNGSGRLIVAPFSVRALPGAPVSMPLQWKEVKDGLDIRSFTIETALARMQKLKRDPMHDVLTEQPDLHAALQKIGQQ